MNVCYYELNKKTWAWSEYVYIYMMHTRIYHGCVNKWKKKLYERLMKKWLWMSERLNMSMMILFFIFWSSTWLIFVFLYTFLPFYESLLAIYTQYALSKIMFVILVIPWFCFLSYFIVFFYRSSSMASLNCWWIFWLRRMMKVP